MNASCPYCHMVVEPGNRLILPDGKVVHRDKAKCFGRGNLTPAQAEKYYRLYTTHTDLDRVQAYRLATGRDWEGYIPPAAPQKQPAAQFAS